MNGSGNGSGAAAVPPAVIAAAAADVRAYLRMAGDGEAALVERAVRSACQLAEAFTGVVLVERLHEDVVAVDAAWRMLAAVPVVAIEGATALPIGAAPVVLPVESYAIDIDADARGWLRVSDAGGARRVAVSYRAGLAPDWGAVPAALAQGVVALAAHLVEDRGGMRQPPASVAALWRPWRRMRVGAAELRA